MIGFGVIRAELTVAHPETKTKTSERSGDAWITEKGGGRATLSRTHTEQPGTTVMNPSTLCQGEFKRGTQAMPLLLESSGWQCEKVSSRSCLTRYFPLCGLYLESGSAGLKYSMP